MKKHQKEIIGIFGNIYPEVKPHLKFSNNIELAIAVMLSAQCTDKQVNKVTPKLFSRCKTLKDYLEIPQKELEKLIYSTGFYKNKAKNIKAFAKKLISDFNGELPKTLKELTTLPGIGRKTANVIEHEAFNKIEGIVVDTHVLRLSYRMGFGLETKNAEKQEKELMKVLPKKYWYYYSHWCILLGRSFCISRKPKCKECPLKDSCTKNVAVTKII